MNHRPSVQLRSRVSFSSGCIMPPLKVIVVGAGIAGLCAAVSLRQAGHEVTLFEKSRFAAEIGAAVAIAPNGAQVLSALGFSFEKARACVLQAWETVDGTNLKQLACQDFSNAKEKWGGWFMSIHRVDLHNELLRLALEGDQNPVTLRLGARVCSIEAEKGSLKLEDGSTHQADLIVAADGLHSVLRSFLLGDSSTKPKPSGLSAFRFLVPTKQLEAGAEFEKLLKWKQPCATIFVDTVDRAHERHLVWYPCRGGEVQNIVGIHPTSGNTETEHDAKKALLEQFSYFEPDVVRLLGLAENVKCWPLFKHDPLPSWVYGKVILIGDAAHPMLPLGGQAANQAIEDGGSLGFLLHGVENPTEVPARLRKLEVVRKKRASIIQILSSVRVGMEKEVEADLWPFAEPGATKVPTTFAERTEHAFRFNAIAKCKEVLQAPA